MGQLEPRKCTKKIFSRVGLRGGNNGRVGTGRGISYIHTHTHSSYSKLLRVGKQFIKVPLSFSTRGEMLLSPAPHANEEERISNSRGELCTPCLQEA